MAAETAIQNTFKRVIEGTAIIFIGNVIGAGAGFATRLIAARYLGPTDYGLIILGVTVFNMISLILLFGLNQGLARQIPRTNQGAVVFQSALLFAVPLSVPTGLLLVVFSDSIAAAFSTPRLSIILAVLAVALPFNVFLRLAIGGLQGLEDTRGRVIIYNIFHEGLIAVLVAITALLGFGTILVTASWPAALFTASIIAIIYIRSTTSLLTFSPANWRKEAKGLLLFSLPLMFSDVLWELMNQIDNIFIGYFHSSEWVGVYDASFILVQPIWILASTFGFIFFPIFSRLHNDSDIYQMREIYNITSKWIVFLTFPYYIYVLFYPNQILAVMFGEGYSAGATALIILSSAFFIRVLMGLNGGALAAMGNTREILRGCIGAFCINSIANYLLVPPFRITGAAIASAVAFIALYAYYAYILFNRTGIFPLQLVTIVPIVIGGAIFGFILFLSDIWVQNTSIKSLLSFVVFPIIYILLILALGIEQEDMRLFQEYSARLPVERIKSWWKK